MELNMSEINKEYITELASSFAFVMTEIHHISELLSKLCYQQGIP
jgi:hypothetical protein